jgi:signal transduction histidine kinase
MPTSCSPIVKRLPEQSLSAEGFPGHAGRPPDYAAENLALVRLARILSESPGEILSELATVALELCDAGSAGISILESADTMPPAFRWRAVSGAWMPYLGAVMPRESSPCGRAFECDDTHVMRGSVYQFPCVNELRPTGQQELVAPFYLGDMPMGALWVVKHDPSQEFDGEDARVLSSLANFTSAAYRTLKLIENLECIANRQRDEIAALTDTDRSKDAFIATIAHELRDPLAPLLNAGVVLKLGGATDLGVVIRASELIVRQVRKISRLVDDLLDFSRIRLGTLGLRLSEVDLAAVLHSAIEASVLVTGPTSHKLELLAIESPLPVMADEMRLSQVLQNLLNNAAKYTDPSGVVRIGLKREHSQAVLTISDTGIGIAAEQIDGIFDLFAQAGQAGTPRSQGGLGIGLHLARQLVAAHGGSLTAYSAGVGLGSTFTVRLNRRAEWESTTLAL